MVPKEVASYAEWLSKGVRRELVELLHSQVSNEALEERGRGRKGPRPNINAKVAAILGVTELAVIQMRRGDYACSDVTARKIVSACHERDLKETRKLVLSDLKAHQDRLRKAIEELAKKE